jgi:hypothetical protein
VIIMSASWSSVFIVIAVSIRSMRAFVVFVRGKKHMGLCLGARPENERFRKKHPLQAV